MDQLKPIEPGCLALIVKSAAGNTGSVRVGKYVGHIPGLRADWGPYWETDRMHKGELGLNGCELAEDQLMRIDGDWEGKETEVEETLKEQ
jgi:hypothetical protein